MNLDQHYNEIEELLECLDYKKLDTRKKCLFLKLKKELRDFRKGRFYNG